MIRIDNSHWRYFLALEDELLNMRNFVEFHKNNESTFSIKFRSIILQACSEIEKMCKFFCGIPQDDKADMEKYRNYFLTEHKDFYEIKIEIPFYNETIQPWANWKDHKSPDFWKGYTEIKHQGKLESAHLENSTNSLAGLFALLLAWYFKNHGKEFSEEACIAPPKLFHYPNLEANVIVTSESHRIEVPGF